MSVDWNQVRRCYEGGGSSLRRVAEQFGLSVSTLLKRAAREQWKQHAAVDSISEAQDGIKGINRPEFDSNLESIRGIKPSDQTEFDSISGVQDGIKGIKRPEVDSNLESTRGIKPSDQTEFDSISGVQDGIKGINHPEFDSTPRHGWVIPEDIHSWDRLRAASFYHQQLGWAVHPLVPPDRGDDKERGKKPCSKGWRDHKAADVTPEDLHEVFSSRTPYNLGVVVRPPFVAVDLDSKPDSGASVRAWLEAHPALAAVPRERTGGGAHLHFICRDLPEGVLKSRKALTCQLTPQVSAELYFDGLNLVLSPSVHKSGHRYTWEVTGPIPEVSWEQLRRWFGFATPEVRKPGRPAKEKPWWSQWREDLRTLDLVKVAGELDILGGCLDPDTGKWAVRCPWQDQHSERAKGEPGSDTVLFNAPGTLPAFRCLHAHCAGRGLPDFVQWCESQRPGIIAAHCTGLRVWQPGVRPAGARPKIELPGTGRSHSEFATELGEVIGPRLDLFQFSRNVVEITMVKESDARGAIPGTMLHTLKAADLVTAAERSVETGVLRQDEAGDSVFMQKSMAESDARVVLSARQFLSRLPRIVRLLDVPVPVLHEGQVVYPRPGYDERFGTWLSPDAPTLRPMGFEEALRLLLGELFCQPEEGGFWWQDEQARVHALARLITPFCRGLMRWKRTPLWIYDGNREGCGKDTCADVTHVLYTGRSIICAPLSKDGDEEMRKRITSALMAGSRFFHLANMKGHVRYAALEAATDNSGIWEDRRLGVSETLVLPNETEFSFSANNATWEPDIERRCRRIRLRFTPEDINGHRYRQPNLLDWVRQNRSELLSAIAALVAQWVGNGCPPGPSPFTSFPDWGRVVGGILAACGLPDPCQPHADSQSSGDQDTRAMRQFFGLGHDRFGSEWTPKNTVYEWVREVEEVQELFDWIDFTQKRGMVAFAKLLAKFDGRELGGVVFGVQRTSANCCKYRFLRPSEPSALISSGASPTVRCEVEGGFSSRSACAEKCGAISENERPFNESLHNGQPNLTAPHTSLSAVFCTARSDLERIGAHLAGASGISVDIETYGAGKGDGLDPWKGEIRLLSLCREGGPIWTLDLRAIGYDLGELKPILESTEIIAHNAKFDLLWLRVKCGLRASKVFCTLTAARLLTAGTKPGNDLDKCLERYLGIAPAPDHSRSDWGSMFLTEDQLAYAARDVAHLHALSNKLWGELEHEGLDRVARLEFDLVPVIVEMEAAGIAVDKARLREIETRARSSASDHAGMLRQKLNLPKLNPGSPQQLLEALKAAGIELENTNEETLKAADDGEIIPLILDYRGAEKLAQQAASLLECVKQDGRIHGRFDPTGTATGRFSSKDPNLQNVGRGELRTCFVPEPGNKLIVADYSQIELRAAAVIAGEKKMIEAYKNGVDLHKQTASEVLGKPLDEVTKEDRQTSKACFSGDTEVLTPKGWVRFDQYDGRAEVAQYVLPEGVVWNPPRPRSNRWGHPTGKVHWDAGNGAIEFATPLGFQSFEDRELFHHEDRNTDLMVTADHQIAFITNAGDARKVAAAEVTTGNCRHFIAAGHLQGCTPPNTRLELFTRSLAMVIADGYFSSARCVRFGFSKQRKVERCLKLLSALGFHPKVSTSGRVTNISVADAVWVDAMRAWTQGGKDLSWSCLHQLPARIYLEEAANWDSHVILGAQRDRALFCTTSKQTAEVMQAMAALSGIPSLLSCSPKTNPKHKPTYRLSYVLRGPSTWRASWNLKPTGRRETVWCVQVPSGAIIVRRNGKVCVQGNCNFGLLYGQSAPGLVRYAASSYGVQMELGQSEQIRRQFFRTYDRLRQWHGVSHNQADAGAREVRTVLGRRRLIPETASEWERFTALVNTPVQGGCADGMKQALVLIAERLPDGARLISTVHDEVLVEAPESIAEQVCELVREAMIEAMAALFPQVPIEVEAGVCAHWGEK